MIVGLLSQLSVAVAVPVVTCAAQIPGSVGTLRMDAGQVITGAVVSLTVNVTWIVVVLPAPLLLLEPSFAESVMVCGPSPTGVPAAGLCVTVMSWRLSQITEVSELAQAQLSETVARAV